MSLTDELKRRATALGFCAVGVTGSERFSEAETAAANRTRQGLMDGLSWWSEARARASADPRRAAPDARSVIALAFRHPVVNPPSPSDGPRGRIAAYAVGRDYHDVLLERMQPLVAMLRERGHVAKTYVDHGWMLDRAAAARAGLGWLGVCPTGALVEPGVLDNRRCISFWTIEHRGVIPLDIRPLIGDWIFGCDLCQEICPVNARPATPDTQALESFGPMIEARPRLEELLALDDDGFRARFRNSAVWRTRRSGLLRNVCIALGNIADRGSVPALAVALDDGEPLVRGHAAWALGRLGGAAARAQLEQALRRETDAWVRDECAQALQACGPLVVPSVV